MFIKTSNRDSKLRKTFFTIIFCTTFSTAAIAAKPGTDPNDTDGDGLSNSEEALYGTNPRKADTDRDGLSDGDEVYIYFTDPTLDDTDGDGNLDGDEIINGTDPLVANALDSDGDGLSDTEEAALGTNPAKSDSDRDGLNDGEEVNI